MAGLTLAAVMALNHFTRGFCRLASILLGMLWGYGAALLFGMVDFSPIREAARAAAPRPLPFGISFELAPCVAMGLLFAINSIQAIGDLTATTVGLSAALGVGVSQASAALSQFPEAVTLIFGKSPVVVAPLLAVLLNLVLPSEE